MVRSSVSQSEVDALPARVSVGCEEVQSPNDTERIDDLIYCKQNTGQYCDNPMHDDRDRRIGNRGDARE